MSKLIIYREKLNLTQKELSEKSGISIRTIQRIEAGTEPKGHTLKTLASSLNINEQDLLFKDRPNRKQKKEALKLINFSSLLFFIPLANIFCPILLMRMKKLEDQETRQLISIQILWTVAAFLVIGISPFLVRWAGISRQWTSKLVFLFFIINLFLILGNAIKIQKNGKPLIELNFTLL
jgi:transcriptional regulator with XRE-family HTH domain